MKSKKKKKKEKGQRGHEGHYGYLKNGKVQMTNFEVEILKTFLSDCKVVLNRLND